MLPSVDPSPSEEPPPYDSAWSDNDTPVRLATAALIEPIVLPASAGTISHGRPRALANDAGSVTLIDPPDAAGAGGGSDDAFSSMVSPLTNPAPLRLTPSAISAPPNHSA